MRVLPARQDVEVEKCCKFYWTPDDGRGGGRQPATFLRLVVNINMYIKFKSRRKIKIKITTTKIIQQFKHAK